MARTDLDLIDKLILDVIQSDFPIAARPYAVIAERLKAGGELAANNVPVPGEEEILERVNRMRRGNIIRRLGANFQSSKLGYRSTLCAAKVPAEKLDAFIDCVNAKSGVTHNYLRRHEYNVWFTVIGASWENVCACVSEIESETGVSVLNLPAEKLYKIRVDFAMA